MKMDKYEFEKLFYRYCDGELDDDTAQRFEEYIQECPLSALEVEKEKKFNDLLKNNIIKHEAPYALREAVVDGLEKENNQSLIEKMLGVLKWRPSLVPSSVFAVATIIAVATIMYVQFNNVSPVFASSVSRHIDYLNGALPLDIVSSDVDEVSGWFDGKVDFAIKVPNLSEHGVTMSGARLCHVCDKKVAFLILEKSGEQISMFVIDLKDMQIPRAKKIVRGNQTFYIRNHQGYRSILYVEKGNENTGCLFVTKLPENEILELMV